MTTDRPAFTGPDPTGPKTGIPGAHGPSWDGDELPPLPREADDHLMDMYLRAVLPKPQSTTKRFVVTIDVTTPGHPRAALESSLRQLPRKVYEVVSVDEQVTYCTHAWKNDGQRLWPTDVHPEHSCDLVAEHVQKRHHCKCGEVHA